MKKTIEVAVPYKGPGNTIVQKDVRFDLVQSNGQYSLIPQLEENERRIANLPEALRFTLDGDRIEPERGIREGNLHVIRDAVAKLKAEGAWPA
jgi:hypothetical protein